VKNPGYTPRVTSLSVQRPDAGGGAQDLFYKKLDDELAKIGDFSVRQMTDLRTRLTGLAEEVEAFLEAAGRPGGAVDRESPAYQGLVRAAKDIGSEYLAMEKFVNLNYMGVHKILKKHDKNVKEQPIRQFYISRVHQQPWVQGNFSDIIVHLSNIHSLLRQDATGQKNEDSAQGFVRSTTKYWVRTSDVSVVKHFVLQHLPVFQFDKDKFAGDAQLVNSAYYDNSNMELYHGRLDKRPGAIALRMRWYGNGYPRTVFVERKTHRESWKGETSVKERFVLPEEQVLPFLQGRYTLDEAKAALRDKGKKEEEIEKFAELFEEIQQTVDAKQLCPMVRTQYMRTAFQIPYDATVRVSLDTNLCMIKENPDDGPTCYEAGRWFRDPEDVPGRTEITRFPHAILEIKLSLNEGDAPPSWVQELLQSGYVTEVHKFSKFIHGSATLLPDSVQAVPYWIDDESIRASMLASAALPDATPRIGPAGASPSGPGRGDAGGLPGPSHGIAAGSRPRLAAADGEARHPLLGAAPTLQLLGGPDRGHEAGGGGGGGAWVPRWVRGLLGMAPAGPPKPRKMPMRIEPKTYFANERTFLNWMHMSIVTGTIASALLGLSGGGGNGGESPDSWSLSSVISLVMLPVAIMIAVYALYTFYWRLVMIRRREVAFFDDKHGPLVLAGVIVFALSVIFVVSLVEFVQMVS